jgi:hypothetical protein
LVAGPFNFQILPSKTPAPPALTAYIGFLLKPNSFFDQNRQRCAAFEPRRREQELLPRLNPNWADAFSG